MSIAPNSVKDPLIKANTAVDNVVKNKTANIWLIISLIITFFLIVILVILLLNRQQDTVGGFSQNDVNDLNGTEDLNNVNDTNATTPTSTIATANGQGDAYSGWEKISVDSYGVTIRVPSSYDVLLPSKTWTKEANGTGSDIEYNDIEIYNGSKLILWSYMNITGDSPMICEIADPATGTKLCETVYSKTVGTNTYELLADSNGYDPSFQFLKTNLYCGSISPICDLINNKSVGVFFKFEGYNANSQNNGYVFSRSLTEDEFNNIALIIASVVKK